MKRSNVSGAIFLALWLLLPLLPLLAKPGGLFSLHVKLFTIKKVKGPVLAWEPWTSSWEPVEEGMQLWEDSLIQIGHQASLTFELDAKQGFRNLKADRVEVTLNRPMVIRLEEEVLREVKLNSYFISDLPGKIKKTEDHPSSSLPLSLTDAWNRFAPMLGKKFEANQEMWDKQNAGDEADSKVAANAKKIQIFTPRDGAMVIAETFPVPLKVTWKKIPEDVHYQIRLWKADGPQGSPVAVTTADNYLLKLYEEGSFYIQVSAEDERWVSSVHQITVVQPIQGKTLPVYGAKTAPDKRPTIELSLPPTNFTYFSSKVPQTFSFRWAKIFGAAANQFYYFQVTDFNGKIIDAVKTSTNTASFKIEKPGEYRWSVGTVLRGKDEQAKPMRIYSELRTFRVLPFSSLSTFFALPRQTASPVAIFADPLATLLSQRSDNTFYLEQGL